MKTCSTCRVEKPLTEFNKNRKFKDNLSNQCRPCAYDSARKNKYGLTPEEYQALKDASGNTCYICGASPGARELDIDHCHTTGKVRGLLCPTCNKGLGLFNDNIALLESTIKYLSHG